MTYDFRNLSPADFEDLVRDLLGEALAIRFEAFTAGPDGGIDGRHASGGQSTIIQAKHYAGSSFPHLKRAIKNERTSIDRIAPSRYLLGTSQRLTPNNKRQLSTIIGPALHNEADIYGADDINALLRNFPAVEKSHIKLWLSNAAVLDRIINSATYNYTAISKSEIAEKVNVYALNPSFRSSQQKLDSQHVLIISGPPGVGKTTLAEMLSYTYLAEGWEFIAIRSLDEGFTSINDSQKQIFLFDDFLGTIALDKRALSSKDSELARFLNRVRKSPNARFVLTTRAYIFEEARRVSEHLADTRLDISKYLLDVGVYTRRIRARILYNHLLVANTPKAHIAALIESGKIPDIVDHKNYVPRVIEWMTDRLHIRDIPSDNYAEEFLAVLANPKRLWDIAFRTHIDRRCQHLLFSLFFGSASFGVAIDSLRFCYDSLNSILCRKYREPYHSKDFDEAVRVLEGSFIAIRGNAIDFINPSVRDYLADYIDDFPMILDFASSAMRADWAREVWRHGSKYTHDTNDRKALALAFLGIAREFTRMPTRSNVRYGTAYSWSAYDLCNSDRIALLINWWEATHNEEFSEIALAVAANPVGGMDAWRDGSDVVELIWELRADHYEGLPHAADIAARLECDLIDMLQHGIAFDDLESIAEYINVLGSDSFSTEIKTALYEAVDGLVREAADIANEIDADSELEEYANTMKKLALQVSIPDNMVSSAVTHIKKRMVELEDERLISEGPTIVKEVPVDRDTFDDAELRNLFMPLISG